MQHMNPRSMALTMSILARAPELSLATVMANGAPHASTVSFANDGLVLYAAVGIDSQKAHNVRRHPVVALTINAPYQRWSEIQALSIGALADIVSDPEQVRLAGALLLKRFPEFAEVVTTSGPVPWPGTLYIRIRPQTVSLLNYAEGFGHTTYHTVMA